MLGFWWAIAGPPDGDEGRFEEGAGAAFEPPHPGVAHPRGRVRGEWSKLTDGLIIGVLGLLVFIALFSAAASSPVGKVRRWRTVEGLEGQFTIEVPAGWRIDQAGNASDAYIMLISRSRWVRTYVVIYQDLAASAAVWSTSQSCEDPRTLTILHQRTHTTWSDYFGQFQSGRPAPTRVGNKQAIWSRLHFTDGAENYAGREMRGIRTTMAHGKAGVLIATVSPAENWSEFEPIAMQITKSIRFRAPVSQQRPGNRVAPAARAR